MLVSSINEWEDMVTAKGVKLYVGLAAYKCGAVDTWAGDSGKYEWVNNDQILTDMTKSSREADSYGGVVFYRYDSLFNPASNVAATAKSERQSLVELF